MSIVINSNPQKMINGKYLVKRKISSGSFGVVFLGKDIESNEYVAIKIEKQQGEQSSLLREVFNQYKMDQQSQCLIQLQGLQSIPKLYWYGLENGNNSIVLQFLGRDLTYYLKTLRKFSLKTVLNIADQLLQILESIHKRNVLHRDIKPENVLVGRGKESHLIYLVDFGISKIYRDSKGQHILYKEKKPFIGTTRYASIAAHRGQELSRKDDLESLGYMLIFLLKEIHFLLGRLQWQDFNALDDKLKIYNVGQMKQKQDSLDLCKDLPIEFARYLDYVKKLNFSTQPDYKYLQQLFKKLNQSNFNIFDKTFDWDAPAQTVQRTSEAYILQKRPLRNASDDPKSMIGKQEQKPTSSQINIGSVQDSDVNVFQSHSQFRSDPKQSSLSPLLPFEKNQNNKSPSSFNGTYSDQDYINNSIMVGVQPSMISVQSKLSRQSVQSYNRFRGLSNEVKQSQYHSPQRKRFKSSNDQIYREQQPNLKEINNQETFTARCKVQLNADENDLNQKYQLLKKSSLNAQIIFLQHVQQPIQIEYTETRNTQIMGQEESVKIVQKIKEQ